MHHIKKIPIIYHYHMIEISHARANNLKNISLKIPRDKLIVIAGV